MSVRRSRPSTLRIKNNGFTSKYHYIGKVSVRKPFFFCLFLWFFEIFLQKVFVIPEKAVPLHSHFKKCSCDVRLHLSKKRAFCLRFALTLSPKIGVWCNGNTADSGPAFPGSSPGTPTDYKRFPRRKPLIFIPKIKIKSNLFCISLFLHYLCSRFHLFIF